MAIAEWDGLEFSGAKLALFFGDYILVLLRDDRPDIPDPGMWDLPGGCREGDETPAACVLRETLEETGISLLPEQLRDARSFCTGARRGWLFVARLPFAQIGTVRFGDEGQGWTLFRPAQFLDHPQAVPVLQHRLSVLLVNSQPA